MGSFRKAHKAIKMLAGGTKHKYSREYTDLYKWWNYRRARPAFAAIAVAQAALQIARINITVDISPAMIVLRATQVAMDLVKQTANIYNRKQF